MHHIFIEMFQKLCHVVQPYKRQNTLWGLLRHHRRVCNSHCAFRNALLLLGELRTLAG